MVLLFARPLLLTATHAAEAFQLRGYYVTFMRMPVMGLPEWKEAIDCFAEDKVNLLVLWTAGGFRSKQFPITWKYNQEHANVTNDFGRELIDYTHSKGIRVLLGFTPFGYDGVNQYPLEHPELKAKKADGSPVDQFGIHCWGWNLCPALEESQRFMREYISEMVFDFYPNADGLLVESSDYNICRCPRCGPKFYDHEFGFVKWISQRLWERKPEALIVVFPHYFTGLKVPGLDATAARQPFDSRWGLAFSPHSSHFNPELIAKARESIYWSDAPILGTPRRVAEAARTARQNGVSGFVPSMEAFSYVTQRTEGGEPGQVGLRRQAFALDTLREGRMPYRSLLARIQRFAFREFSDDPTLAFPEFEQRLGKYIFGNDATAQKVEDLLEVQRIYTFESDWYWPSPLIDPDFFAARAKQLNFPPEKLATYRAHLEKLKTIDQTYRSSGQPPERELGQLAHTVVRAWGDRSIGSVHKENEASAYATREIEGWTVQISAALLESERTATEIALELLRKQLQEIARVVPAEAVFSLRQVHLWFSPEYAGVKPKAEYHPGADWLREHGRNPAMVKNVEFTNVRQFEKEMNRMPNFVLHELAHAYHDRVLPDGFNNQEIKAAYERSKASNNYDRVERWFGNGRPNTFEPAYALSSPQEYFAESTEAFFSRNDFFPFTRDELKRHDPEMHALVERLWNTSQSK